MCREMLFYKEGTRERTRERKRELIRVQIRGRKRERQGTERKRGVKREGPDRGIKGQGNLGTRE